MFWRRTATTTHNADAVILNEMLMKLRELRRFQFVHCMSAFVLRKPGVRQNGKFFGGIQAKVSNSIIHLGWAGGAIHAEDVDIERFERRRGRADFGAKKH